MVMYPINARSKHLAEAWEFLKYIRNVEADMIYTDFELGGLATTLQVLNSPDCAKRKAWDVYRNEVRNSKPWPAHPDIIPVAKNILAPYGQKAIIGEMTAQDAMDAAVKEAQELLEGKR
jgi:maltose-binding protein MalE